MATKKFDVGDVAFWGLLLLSIVPITRIGTVTFLGYGMTDTLFTLFGETVTYGDAGVLVGALGVLVTNGMDQGDILGMITGDVGPARDDDMMGTLAQVGIILAVLYPVISVFIPGFESFVTGSDIIGVATAAVITFAVGLAAYEY